MDDFHVKIAEELGKIRGSMNEGFKGVHQRLDSLNGKVSKHDDDIRSLQIFDAKNEGKNIVSAKWWGVGGSVLVGFVVLIITMYIK